MRLILKNKNIYYFIKKSAKAKKINSTIKKIKKYEIKILI